MPIRKVKSAYKAYKARKTAKVMKRAARVKGNVDRAISCLLYTSPSPRDS